jgi:hypothetical protein
MAGSRLVLLNIGDTSYPSAKSGDSLYMEGEVKFVKAVEFGADMDGSRTIRSCGETVPMLVELEVERVMLVVRSYKVGTAGELYMSGNDVNSAAAASKSKPGKSPSKRSIS